MAGWRQTSTAAWSKASHALWWGPDVVGALGRFLEKTEEKWTKTSCLARKWREFVFFNCTSKWYLFARRWDDGPLFEQNLAILPFTRGYIDISYWHLEQSPVLLGLWCREFEEIPYWVLKHHGPSTITVCEKWTSFHCHPFWSELPFASQGAYKQWHSLTKSNVRMSYGPLFQQFAANVNQSSADQEQFSISPWPWTGAPLWAFIGEGASVYRRCRSLGKSPWETGSSGESPWGHGEDLTIVRYHTHSCYKIF